MPMRFQHSPVESLARQHPVSAPDAYSKIPQDPGQAHEISELARLKVWLSMCMCLSRGLRNALDSGGALACKLRKLGVVETLFSRKADTMGSVRRQPAARGGAHS